MLECHVFETMQACEIFHITQAARPPEWQDASTEVRVPVKADPKYSNATIVRQEDEHLLQAT